MFEIIFSFIENSSNYIDLFLTIVVPVGTFFLGLFFKKKKNKVVKKILSLKENVPCEVIIPTWAGNLEFSVEEASKLFDTYGREVATYDYVRKEEAEALFHIQNLLNVAEIKSDLLIKSPSSMDFKDENNKFICGGPLANIYLKRIFSGENISPFSFKRRFLFGVKPHWYHREENKKFQELEILIPEDFRGRYLYVEKDSLDGNFDTIYIPEGFIVLIRYVSKNRGTFFISFGNSAQTSMKGLASIIEDSDELYDIVKKHKRNFFLLLKCSPSGDLCFEDDCVLDLTEKMFGE